MNIRKEDVVVVRRGLSLVGKVNYKTNTSPTLDLEPGVKKQVSELLKFVSMNYLVYELNNGGIEIVRSEAPSEPTEATQEVQKDTPEEAKPQEAIEEQVLFDKGETIPDKGFETLVNTQSSLESSEISEQKPEEALGKVEFKKKK